MIPHTKKRRYESDDVLVGEVSAAIESMAAETEGIIRSVGTVNGAVLESLLGKVKHAENALKTAGSSAVQMWKLIVQSQQNGAVNALNHIAVAECERRKGHVIAALEQQLVNSASAVEEEVRAGLDAAYKTTLELFSSQLTGEQETNHKLVSRVQEFLRDALRTIQSYSRRAVEAELLLLKKDISVARLQSSLSFYQNASLRHDEEVMTLINIVRILATKSKDVDLAQTKLRQSKTHVRLLEKHLDLAGIVHAIVPPGFVPPRPNAERPNEALKRTAPEFFALRLLEHNDVTLSELVDSWQQQEARIMDAEEKYRRLEMSVESLRREALTVREGFLQEKRRRELVEQRLVDLVRERIHPSGNNALVHQLSLLRADHTKALDDLVQITTVLNVTREELSLEQEKNTLLRTQIQQMQDDSANDEVANTLASLRHHYESEINRLRSSLVDADSQSAIAVACAEVQQKASTSAHNALIEAEKTITDMSATLQRVENQVLIEQQKCLSHSQSDQFVEDVQKILSQSEVHLNNAVSSFQVVMQESEKRREKDVTVFENQVKLLLESLQALLPILSHGEYSASASTTEARQEEEVRSMMRTTLLHALQFVSDNLVSNEISKTSLLDASIADVHHINLLLKKIQELTTERDDALERLTRCERLIDEHSLTAVERVLMHEVSVEESLDAVEAFEQITTLRKKLSSLETAHAVALTEVKDLNKKLKYGQEQTETALARVELLEHHNSRLVKSIEECLGREVTLIEQVHHLQRNLQQWGEKETTSDVPTDSSDVAKEEGEGGEKFGPLMHLLEHLSGGISAMKEQLSGIQRTVVSTSSEAAEEGDVVEVRLLRRGIRQVADSLREALQRAELLRHALPLETGETKTSNPHASPETVANEEENENENEATVTEGKQQQQHSESSGASSHALEIKLRDEKLAQLLSEVEAQKQIIEQQRSHEKDLEEKVNRLLQIQKQLLGMKASQAATTSTTNTSGASPSQRN